MSEDRSSNGQGQRSWLRNIMTSLTGEPKTRRELLELYVMQNSAYSWMQKR